MARKSNKTAHVLGLIATNKTKSDTTEEQKDLSLLDGEQKDRDSTVLEMSTAGNETMSALIKDKLLEEIGESPQSSPASGGTDINLPNDSTPGKQENDIQTAQSEPPQEGLKQDPPNSVDINSAQKTPVVSSINFIDFDDPDGAKQAAKLKDAGCSYINVLETLVLDKIEEYMQSFNVCTCSRCLADTTALALTNLPSKYIVTDGGNTYPLLNYYRNKYATIITAELTKACLIVASHPHHQSRNA